MAHIFGNVISHIGCQSGFTHGRTAGDDDKVGIVQAAGFVVQRIQLGRQAGDFAVFLISRFNVTERRGQSRCKVGKAALGISFIGEIKKFFFSHFNLAGCIGVEVFFHSLVDDFIAGVDQFPAEVFVINKLGIIFSIGQRGSAVGQFDQILVAADFV